jgi:hypothetical protein
MLVSSVNICVFVLAFYATCFAYKIIDFIRPRLIIFQFADETYQEYMSRKRWERDVKVIIASVVLVGVGIMILCKLVKANLFPLMILTIGIIMTCELYLLEKVMEIDGVFACKWVFAQMKVFTEGRTKKEMC